MIPGGIRDRALRAVLARGFVPEDLEKTKASQEFWRAFREKRAMTGCRRPGRSEAFVLGHGRFL
jgi:hypothetical protein